MKSQNSLNIFRHVSMLTAAASLLLLIAVFAAPVLKQRSNIIGEIIYLIFSPLCHQIDSRCFYIYGLPLAVCARCLGIYSGLFMGSVIFLFSLKRQAQRAPTIKTFLFASFPIAVDAMGNLLGIWAGTSWIRFLTGMIWGIILPMIFIHGISDLIFSARDRSGKPFESKCPDV